MTTGSRFISPLLYERAGGGRFQLGASALGRIAPFVQDEPDMDEAGGVLLGRHIIGTDDIAVDSVTVPMQGDRRGRFRFYRARRRHQAIIDRAWEESDGTCTYLGEWHTHPEAWPSPSPLDGCEWRRKLVVDRFSGYLFFVIVGTDHVRVWEGPRRRITLHPLERVR